MCFDTCWPERRDDTIWYLENIATHAGFGPSRTQEHINMWELDQRCWEVLLFFHQQNPSTIGIQESAIWPESRSSLRALKITRCWPMSRNATDFEDHLHGKVTPSGNWNWAPIVKLWRPLGKLSPSRVFRLKSYLNDMSCILSKSSPNVKLRRLLGKFTASKVLSK